MLKIIEDTKDTLYLNTQFIKGPWPKKKYSPTFAHVR